MYRVYVVLRGAPQPGPHDAGRTVLHRSGEGRPWMMRLPAPPLWLRRGAYLPATDQTLRLQLSPANALPALQIGTVLLIVRTCTGRRRDLVPGKRHQLNEVCATPPVDWDEAAAPTVFVLYAQAPPHRL